MSEERKSRFSFKFVITSIVKSISDLFGSIFRNNKNTGHHSQDKPYSSVSPGITSSDNPYIPPEPHNKEYDSKIVEAYSLKPAPQNTGHHSQEPYSSVSPGIKYSNDEYTPPERRNAKNHPETVAQTPISYKDTGSLKPAPLFDDNNPPPIPTTPPPHLYGPPNYPPPPIPIEKVTTNSPANNTPSSSGKSKNGTSINR